MHDATGPLGGILGWLTNTIGSAILGLVVGAVVVAVMHVIPSRRGSHGGDGGHGESASRTENAALRVMSSARGTP